MVISISARICPRLIAWETTKPGGERGIQSIEHVDKFRQGLAENGVCAQSAVFNGGRRVSTDRNDHADEAAIIRELTNKVASAQSATGACATRLPFARRSNDAGLAVQVLAARIFASRRPSRSGTHSTVTRTRMLSSSSFITRRMDSTVGCS